MLFYPREYGKKFQIKPKVISIIENLLFSLRGVNQSITKSLKNLCIFMRQGVLLYPQVHVKIPDSYTDITLKITSNIY